jgi:hypothetical protein
MKRAVVCPYCGRDARLLTGTHVYAHRPDLKELRFWVCRPCDAWVGTHKNSKDHAPLGRLADPALRIAKQQAHAAFDPLWQTGQMSRKEAYRWLAETLAIPAEEAHVGLFDVDRCRALVEAVRRLRPVRSVFMEAIEAGEHE